MLQHLHIENFAIIDRLALDFAPGMTVVTGETGAGKSIIMGALGLVLGDRADRSMVTPGTERALIIADFNIAQAPSVVDWLKRHEFSSPAVLDSAANRDEAAACILKRSINSDGRSRAFINDQPTTLSMLRELAEQLVDIHGQHAHHALLRSGEQLHALDLFAAHTPLLSQCAAAYAHWSGLKTQLAELEQRSGQRRERLELLRYQLGELDAFGLTQEEAEGMNQEHQRLAYAQQLKQTAEDEFSHLYADEQSINQQVHSSLSALEEAAELDPALTPLTEQLRSAQIELEEAARELERYAQRLAGDPERLAEIEQRIEQWVDLARKHHVLQQDLPEHHQALASEVAQLEHRGANLDSLRQQTATAWSEYLDAAATLSTSRRTKAKSLAVQTGTQLCQLGMDGSELHIELHSDTQHPTIRGIDQCNWLIQTNPGMQPKALAKIASGGELSRISLAIQVITVGNSSIPCMVFDEVDVGIGGGTAEVVGRLLRRLAKSTQVICITHQAHVASCGQQHFQVSKSSQDGKTRTTLEPLDPARRIDELARMLGGVDITDTTRKHAKELLESVP